MTQSLQEQFRCWTYRRQYLGKSAQDIETVLHALTAVYSAHPSGPLSLYARVQDFSPDDFTKLEEEGRILCIPAMRNSIFIVPRDAYTMLEDLSCAIGAWSSRFSGKTMQIDLDHFEKWMKAVQTRVDSEFEKIAQLLGAKSFAYS